MSPSAGDEEAGREIGPGLRIRLARGQERLIRPSRREGGLVVVFASFYLDKQCLFSPLPLCAAVRTSVSYRDPGMTGLEASFEKEEEEEEFIRG